MVAAAAGIAAAAISAGGAVGAAALAPGPGGGGLNLGSGFSLTTPYHIFRAQGSDITATGLLSPGKNALNSRFPQALSDLDTLKSQVNPAFGALTNAGVNALGIQRGKAIGDLKSSLGRRKVLGSSFANDSLARVQAEFGQKEAEFRAQTKLAEIDAFSKLLTQEQDFINKRLAGELAEAQFTAGTINNLLSVLNGNAQAAQQRAADDAAGFGQVAGSLAGNIGGSLISAYAGQGGSPNYSNATSKAYYDVNANPSTAALF